MQKPRLLIVSFRLPYRFSLVRKRLKLRPSSGGLATSLKSFLERENEISDYESCHWIGVGDCEKKTFDEIIQTPIIDGNVNLHPLFIPEKLLTPFYNGFCNSVLWPLFLYFPSFVDYKDEYFEAYKKVNLLICEEIVKLYTPGDVIWVHDYQLMLLPEMLRGQLPFTRIGFFLHIPFPTFELYRLLPKVWRSQLLRGLLGANLIGLQTKEYKSYFLEAIEKILNITHSEEDEVEHEGRIIRVKDSPISIDFNKFHAAALTPGVKKKVEEIKRLFDAQKLVLSVDRLDYTKAIINRLESFELFLRLNPEVSDKVSYILVLVPSRDGISKFQKNRRQIEELISRINGQYGNLSWTPIIYQYRSLQFENLIALYVVSDVALVVPVRDGMNLVAKEFIATRNPPNGVLILSETAGASDELKDAILVNPNDRLEIANSIRAACLQPKEVQQIKVRNMQEVIRNHGVSTWATSLLRELNLVYEV